MAKLLSLLAALLSVALLGVVAANPAAADGPSLGCSVTPSSDAPGYPNPCTGGNLADPQASQFQVTFQVLNGAGLYGYTWSVPSPWWGRITSGCGSTSADCTFTADLASANITVSVTLAIGRVSQTVSATAELCPLVGRVSACTS